MIYFCPFIVPFCLMVPVLDLVWLVAAQRAADGTVLWSEIVKLRDTVSCHIFT